MAPERSLIKIPLDRLADKRLLCQVMAYADLHGMRNGDVLVELIERAVTHMEEAGESLPPSPGAPAPQPPAETPGKD